MNRRFALLAVVLLAAGVTSVPKVSQAQACHPAFSDICAPVNPGRRTISVPAEQSGKGLCIILGEWQGENPIILEWNGKYAARKVTGVEGRANAVSIRLQRQREATSIRLYSPMTGDRLTNYEWKPCSTAMASNIENMKWHRR